MSLDLDKARKVLDAIGALQPQIATARMLIELGLTTADAVRAFFQKQDPSLDNATLDGIIAECDWRIARRSQTQGPLT